MTENPTDFEQAPSFVQAVSIEKKPRAVKALPAEVARKIAAGEVIDRPNAVLREFLDNAVDANSTRIIAELTAGGITSIRVVDNGWGMSKDDLIACARPHATSKIVSENDLENLFTLGFRGEALASISAVSRLELTSARGGDAWRLEAYLENEHSITPTSLNSGTIAASYALFENFPARRQFLKRPQAEGTQCKQTFIEKSLPFTHIAFRLVMDEKIRLDLPAGQSLAQRFTFALDMAEKAPLFYELMASDKTWRIRIVLGEPSVYRNDRKQMYVFVNGRRVQEYALLQAMDYGAEGYFPNGTHPVACLFLDIDPALADFNIHPAKKEVRFKDITPIHRAVSSTVRNFYRDFSVRGLAEASLSEDSFVPSAVEGREYSQVESLHPNTEYTKENYLDGFSEAGEKTSTYGGAQAGISSPLPHGKNQFDFSKNIQVDSSHKRQSAYSGFSSYTGQEKNHAVKEYDDFESAENDVAIPSISIPPIRFIGVALDVFLLAEKNDTLYMVDQHAGHERILFERFMQNAGKKQMLLVPLVIETPSSDDDTYLKNLLPSLEAAGFLMTNCQNGRWEVHSVPIKWQGTERDLQSDLLEKRLEPQELIRSLAATTACRAAIKDGHVLDRATAEQLLQDIFSLKDPHCPHGRPLWTKISKEELYKAVRRL